MLSLHHYSLNSHHALLYQYLSSLPDLHHTLHLVFGVFFDVVFLLVGVDLVLAFIMADFCALEVFLVFLFDLHHSLMDGKASFILQVQEKRRV